MGLFNIFHDTSTQTYDMDSLEGIQAIPVPARDYNTGDPTKDCIYYLLQRKATEHKKNGNMELAIACLKKSNDLSDYESKPLLTEKDYLRLVKYIKLTGDTKLAKLEEQKIYSKHPDFLDKRISNKERALKFLAKAKEFKCDFVYVTSNNTCPICKNYNNKIYSISGKSKQYPPFPVELKKGGNCSKCSIGFTHHFNLK